MRRALTGIRAFFADTYAAPFRSDPRIGELPLSELERRRRAQLLQLLLVTLTGVQALSLFGQLLSAAPVAVLLAQVAALGFGVIRFVLNRFGWTVTASLAYITISAAAVNFASLQGSSALDGRGLVIYGLLSLFIVLTGLVLPRRAIWLVAASIIITVSITATVRPLAPGLIADVSAMGGRENARVVLVAILAVTYLSIAILTWIFARSSYAGLLAVARAFERDRELAALKDQFIVDANHELRTPMMALYGNLELALVISEGVNAEEHHHLLQRALLAGDAVLGLLSSVLDAGVIQAGHFDVRPTSVLLNPLVIAVLETFDPREIGEPSLEVQRANTRPVTVEVPPTLLVFADERRLRQVLVNLLSNALKYSEQGTPITITAVSLPAEAIRDDQQGSSTGQVRITVRDQGLGIPAKDAPRLFQRFVRLERDIAGSVRGTGVGLYLCRELIGAMGGEIWIESSGVPGEGSTFAFTLPLAMVPSTNVSSIREGEMVEAW